MQAGLPYWLATCPRDGDELIVASAGGFICQKCATSYTPEQVRRLIGEQGRS